MPDGGLPKKNAYSQLHRYWDPEFQPQHMAPEREKMKPLRPARRGRRKYARERRFMFI